MTILTRDVSGDLTDLICSQMEAAVLNDVAPTLSWAMTDRKT